MDQRTRPAPRLAPLAGKATPELSEQFDAMAKRMPQVAHIENSGGLADITLDQVAVGDALVIFPHEICPVDGTVVEGRGTMDEAYLTGEPYLVSKAAGAHVFFTELDSTGANLQYSSYQA